jgi:xylose isomerase
LFIGHIGAMDTYALGLRKAAKMKEEGVLKSMVRSTVYVVQ